MQRVIFFPHTASVVSGGLDTSRRRDVSRRRRRFRLQVQTLDTSRRCHLPRDNAFSGHMAIRRQVFTFADSIRSYPSRGESACQPDETELGLLRTHWIIEPPFVDRKSLATMSNVGWVGG